MRASLVLLAFAAISGSAAATSTSGSAVPQQTTHVDGADERPRPRTAPALTPAPTDSPTVFPFTFPPFISPPFPPSSPPVPEPTYPPPTVPPLTPLYGVIAAVLGLTAIFVCIACFVSRGQRARDRRPAAEDCNVVQVVEVGQRQQGWDVGVAEAQVAEAQPVNSSVWDPAVPSPVIAEVVRLDVRLYVQPANLS